MSDAPTSAPTLVLRAEEPDKDRPGIQVVTLAFEPADHPGREAVMGLLAERAGKLMYVQAATLENGLITLVIQTSEALMLGLMIVGPLLELTSSTLGLTKRQIDLLMHTEHFSERQRRDVGRRVMNIAFQEPTTS